MVIAFRRWSGTVVAGAGAFIVVNTDGWIVTAGHTFDVAKQIDSDRPKVAAHQALIDAARGVVGRPTKLISKDLSRLERQADQDWITHNSYWWAANGVECKDIQVLIDADVAVGRLDPFPASLKAAVATFGDPAKPIRPGRSLCRLGFPFAQVPATHDMATNHFTIANADMRYFPIEGILTRLLDDGVKGGHPIKFVETSSPGLLGQSGGPIYDANGTVWGVQNRTHHVPLGFNLKKADGSQLPEQVINLGIGAHVETVLSLMDSMGVSYTIR